MPVDALAARYADLFATLGRPLGPDDRIDEAALATASARLGVAPPEALAAFMTVAGRADDVMRAHDRLLRPDEWLADGSRLVFMEENQNVTLFAVDAAAGDDPPVLMAENASAPVWEEVSGSASEFLRTMVCWSASFGGGAAANGSGLSGPDTLAALDAGWERVGAVNAMTAWIGPHGAACRLEWFDGWRVFLAAASPHALAAAAQELGVTLDPPE